ncbi:MAG: hypothetical protein JW913_17920, partial [Chitinispirillaceae bacterium]|nr:hypothetical protein [Chitinispirillaceae bacterium]
MQIKIADSVLLLLFLSMSSFTEGTTSLFSPFNRYELSYDALLNVRGSFDDTLPPPMVFSCANCIEVKSSPSTFGRRTKTRF